MSVVGCRVWGLGALKVRDVWMWKNIQGLPCFDAACSCGFRQGAQIVGFPYNKDRSKVPLLSETPMVRPSWRNVGFGALSPTPALPRLDFDTSGVSVYHIGI